MSFFAHKQSLTNHIIPLEMCQSMAWEQHSLPLFSCKSNELDSGGGPMSIDLKLCNITMSFILVNTDNLIFLCKMNL